MWIADSKGDFRPSEGLQSSSPESPMIEPTHVLMFALALLSAGLGFGLPRLLYWPRAERNRRN